MKSQDVMTAHTTNRYETVIQLYINHIYILIQQHNIYMICDQQIKIKNQNRNLRLKATRLETKFHFKRRRKERFLLPLIASEGRRKAS